MYAKIKQLCEELDRSAYSISSKRKDILDRVVTIIQPTIQQQGLLSIVTVCTHNSRRSHFAQIAIAIALDFYNIAHVSTYSTGTEVTALHPNTLKALKEIGCFVTTEHETLPNPIYLIKYGEQLAIEAFSKNLEHPSLPTADFIAIMTCSEAAENCPLIPGALQRISTPYHDPKHYDGTPLEVEKYVEKMKEILSEWLYVFRKVKSNLETH